VCHVPLTFCPDFPKFLRVPFYPYSDDYFSLGTQLLQLQIALAFESCGARFEVCECSPATLTY